MSIPMLAAVPVMILIADSMVVPFRSGRFSAAIVRLLSSQLYLALDLSIPSQHLFPQLKRQAGTKLTGRETV